MNIVILGGGPAGRATWAAIPEALVVEKTGPDVEGTNRDFGPHFLWEHLPYFRCKPAKVLSHIDHKVADDESVAAYRKKIGREDDDRDYYDTYGPWGTHYKIVQWPECSIFYNQKVTEIDLTRHAVYTLGGGRLSYDKLICTLPMPVFWRMTHKYGRTMDQYFRWTPIRVWVQPYSEIHHRFRADRGLREEDTYVSVITDPDEPAYRETWRDGHVHTEALSDQIGQTAEPPTVVLYPGKIWVRDPGDLEMLYDEAMKWDVHFSGRYGNWNHTELLHDTYHHALTLREKLGV